MKPAVHLVPDPEPTPLASVLWEEILLPAILGQREEAVSAMERWNQDIPNHLESTLLVISARAMAAIGHTDAVEALLDEALAMNDSVAWSLATVLRPGRFKPSFEPSLPPSEAGDLAADLATALLVEGNAREAAEAVSHGLRVCPEHAELSHWRRFLAQSPPTIAVWAARIRYQGQTPDPSDYQGRVKLKRTDTRPVGHEGSWRKVLLDVERLIPCAASGWMSAERIERRLITGSIAHTPSLRPTGIGRLRDAGCITRHFGTDEDYEEMRADHALVDLEILTDRMVALLEENRPAVATAREIWRMSRWLPTSIIEESARLLSVYGSTWPQVAPVALFAVNWLLRLPAYRTSVYRPGRDYWQAWRARLLLANGRVHEAGHLARTLMAARAPSEDAARILREILDIVPQPVDEFADLQHSQPLFQTMLRQGPSLAV